jgi:protein involved in polysaccharide export with SLBB domain
MQLQVLHKTTKEIKNNITDRKKKKEWKLIKDVKYKVLTKKLTIRKADK